MTERDTLVLALPKGRILAQAMPILDAVGIAPEAAFADDDARQ
ncbi:MAG: ATP phosphoribosyltransferase, partial [Pseudomonadota bacterium]